MKDINIEGILVLVKCSDGNIRQWNKSNRYKEEIEDIIMGLEGEIDLSEQTFNFIKF